MSYSKDTSSESSVDIDTNITNLAREYTRQSGQLDKLESETVSQYAPEQENDHTEAATSFGRRLSRTFSHSLTRIPTSVNPFLDTSNSPILDPYSEKFNALEWTKHVEHIRSQDPETYQSKVAGVSFKNLSAYGYGSSADYQKTVGNLPLDVVSFFKNTLTRDKGEKIEILRNFDGLVRPGETLVVLGRPGSGCTTLLKSIAQDVYGFHLTPETELNYQGITPEQVVKNFRGDVVYNAETETHFPKMCVGDTLKFAALARTPQNRFPGVSREKYADHLRDVIMASFGILHTMNTKVGDDFVRGVSGGERKRVSIAEVLLSGAVLQCWDNSTRGLDSATALEFIKNLKIGSSINGASVLVSLYQASQSAYDEFDKVTVLYKGRQIFFGPATRAKQFFEEMGYACPDRQTTGDFLTSLTSPVERIVRPGFENKVPRTPDEFAAYWKASPDYRQLIQEIDEWNAQYPVGGEHARNFHDSKVIEQSDHARPKSPFVLSFPMQVKLCTWRGFIRLKNEPDIALFTVIGNSIVALILSSILYNQQKTSDSFTNRNTALFFAILFNSLACSLEILTLYAQRPIIEKHHRYAFYHPSAEAISSIICDMPSKIAFSLFFNLVIYFMVNLNRSPGPFFIFYLFSFFATIVMSAVFRTIASVTRTIAEALAPASLMILILITTTGFVIPVVDMHPWFRWINYLNPIAYCFESLMINEYRHRNFTCSIMVPSGPGYESVTMIEKTCAAVGSIPGTDLVSGTEYVEQTFKYYISHLWRNFGILIAFGVFFYFLYIYFAENISAQHSRGEVLIFQRSKLKRMAKDEENQCVTVETTTVTDKPDEDVALIKQNGIFAWRNVCYDIKIKGEPRRLLDNVDGYVKPGTLTALMGSSGAGKTTLLDTLADRVTMGVVTGDMFVNGKPRDNSFQRKTGYVQQQDVHLSTSTVRESLEFSALLRQATGTREEKLAYVDEVIKILEMEEYADAIVGVPGEGLNVEQRKRLTIGVELAAKPDLLLFLDEPTSGLDSQTAWSIMMLMKKLTKSGQAIMCTIHQPSAILFQQFDRLLFLQKGGQTVFYGEIGENASKMIEYFESHGADPCPPDANPAEWMLQVIGAAPGCHSDIDWFNTWRESTNYQEAVREIDEQITLSSHFEDNNSPREHESFAVPLSTQFLVVTKRVFEQYWRTPSYIVSKTAMCLVSPLYIGFTFYKAKNDVHGLQNQMFSVFMITTIFGTLLEQTLPQFVSQRTMYETRERPSKTYSWVAFMVSNLIVEIPWQTLMSVITFFCWYYPVGYYRNASANDATAERGALFFMMTWAFYVFTSTFATMVIAGMDSVESASNLANMLMILCLIFCGVLRTADQLPRFWIFMYRVSPFTYIIATFISSGIAGVDITCSPLEVVHLEIPGNFSASTCGDYLSSYAANTGGRVMNPLAVSDCQLCPLATTDIFLKSIRAPLSEAWRNFGLVCCYIVINCFLALFFYWLARVPKSWKKKKE